MNPYHAWLIRQRIYCEHHGCLNRLTRATRVHNLNGKDYVYCETHFQREYRVKHPIETGLRERARLEAK